jgi:general secretion pathway protein K
MRCSAGFTLIEFLVALMVLAVALAAAVRSGSATVDAPAPLSLGRIESLLARAHADSFARAATEQAVAILGADDPRVDHLNEPWARPLGALTVGGVEVTGVIVDEQAKFNLNNLVRGEAPSPADVATLQRLLELLDLPGALADAIVDWIDPIDAAKEPARARSGDPLDGPTSHRAANRAIADVRELAQVQGMTPEALARLTPYVTALPDETPINVNTASATVLRAVVPALSRADAARIVAERDRAPFRGSEEFLRALSGTVGIIPPIDVKSRFFSAEASAQVGSIAIGYRALIARGERRRAVIVALTQVVP